MSEQNPLISNISPPTELPSFVTLQQSAKETEAGGSKFIPAIPSTQQQENPEEKHSKEPENISEEKFVNELPSVQDIAQALSPLTDGVKNSVLFDWVKSGMKTGVQKAKESIDKVVTTLDPQMSHLIYSGGETEIVVASSNDDKVISIRDAFQSVFGHATVYGHYSQGKSIAAQPVGFENAELAAKERINGLRSNELFIDKVVVAVENFVVEVYKNQWFDVGLLVLNDSSRNITLKSFTQMTSIPLPIINSIQNDTPQDYDKKETGFAKTVGAAMSQYLDTPHYEWHKTYTSIDRIDMITNAAKALATIYKLELEKKKSSDANATIASN